MKKGISKFFTTVMTCLMALSMLLLSGCQLFGQSVTEPKTLSAPTNVRVESGSLCWNPVEYASSYTVSIDNKEYSVNDYQYPLTSVRDGEHVFKVKANGDGILYASSAWSESLTETLVEGGKSDQGYYGQFDELTKNESFLGYGFDVINSSVFSDKYVKTSFPIFNNEKLMEQRLLKVDSKQSYIEEIKSSSMETFMEEWNASAHVNTKWGGKRVGGSVEVEAKYSGGVENAKSKYFHSISIYNQKFYIVMQSDINTYKEIVNDSFKADLYSDMTPAELFDKYGTHFITSAVMGGKINSYYLYSSQSEKSYHDVSAQVSTEVRVFKTGVDVDVSASYRQKAQEENIHIENMLEVIGGDDFGMLSDQDISKNYLEWEKSLDNHASLMGIKDTSSLIPLWQLIDSSLDTRTYTWTDVNGQSQTGSRSQQLQAYFEKYGIEAYNSLMEAADLPEIIVPTGIDNVRVNNTVADYKNEYVVYAGASNDISFTVTPENAVGFTKTASLSENTDLASIDNQNGLALIVSPNCEHDTIFNVVLSAGSVRKTIKVRVIKQYSVIFKSNGGSEVEPMLDVEHGTQIEEPTTTREGYVFKGWFTTNNFVEGTDYKFGEDPVINDLTLYAKWEVYYPEITFVHNVQGSTLLKDKVRYGNSYARPTTPELTGYVFDNFYQDSEMLIPFDFTTEIKAPTNIYVKWNDYYAPITYVHNVSGCDLTSDSVKYNNYLVKPINLTNEGYILKGFYQDVNGLVEFDFATPITAPTTVYVMWEEYYPEITFVHNVQGSTLLKDKVRYGNAYARPTIPELTGYDFDNFYQDSEMLIPFDFTTEIKTPTNIYVKWTPKTYTVSFVTGSESVIAPQQVTYKNKAQEPIEPIKQGYTFMGWYLNSDCTGASFDFNNDLVLDNTTLYARWGEDPITIVFEVNGGNSIDEVSILKGQSLGVNLKTPTRDYYTFDGWYLSNEFIANEKVYSNTKFNENKVLYAKWTINVYTITYSLDGGEVSGEYTKTYSVGDEITLPMVEKDYYSFSGWCVDESLTTTVNVTTLSQGPQSLTLYGKIEANEYTIQFIVENGSLNGNNNVVYTVENANQIQMPTATHAQYPDYIKLDKWVEQGASCAFINDLSTNPRNLILVANFEDWTVYTSIDETPWNVDNGKYIIDWSNETNLDVSSHTNRGVNDNRYDNIDICNGSSEVIFIGEANKEFTNFNMHLVGFESGQQVIVRFVDFKFRTVSSQAIGNWPSNLGHLIIDVAGQCSIASDLVGGNVITNFEQLTFTGSGNMTIIGGNGANATTAGGTGGNGGIAIQVETLTIDMTGNLTAIGGSGGNGATGNNGADGSGNDAPGSNGETGGNGGVGASAIVCETLNVINANTINITAGNGGNGGAGGRGGDGSDDNCAYMGTARNGHGGNGGPGGNGGACNNALVATNVSDSSLIVYNQGIVGGGGRGGDGGDGGDANNGMWEMHGSAGGSGGAGGWSGDGKVQASSGNNGATGA